MRGNVPAQSWLSRLSWSQFLVERRGPDDGNDGAATARRVKRIHATCVGLFCACLHRETAARSFARHALALDALDEDDVGFGVFLADGARGLVLGRMVAVLRGLQRGELQYHVAGALASLDLLVFAGARQRPG